MLKQRSIVLKYGTVQTFFTLPPMSSDHPLSKPKTYSTNDVIGSKLKEEVEQSLPRKKEIILYADMTEYQKQISKII